MKIEEREYTREGFKKYLIEHSDKIFEEDKRKRWLTIYCLLVENDSWKTNLFAPDELKPLGDIYKVTLQNEDLIEEEEQYFIEEYCNGLLLLYTTASKEEYRISLGNRIRCCRGINQMWIKPDLFRSFWKGLLKETGGYIYRFSGRRGSFDDTPCQKRSNYKRRIGYSGDDATQSLEEIEEMYGITPYIIYLKASEDLKIHITNEGLYSAQEASATALNLFFTHLEEIKDEILNLMTTSKSFKFDIVIEEPHLKYASIEAGLIQMADQKIDESVASKMKTDFDNFSFIDVNIETGSLGMTATVIDDIKGSVFDINVSESQILIVPKFNVTFESFINFYKGVVESIDEQANISLLSYD